MRQEQMSGANMKPHGRTGPPNFMHLKIYLQLRVVHILKETLTPTCVHSKPTRLNGCFSSTTARL